MKWANFLHIYQPREQQKDILEAVVSQSYRPILSHIISTPNIRLSMNITGALLELFDKYDYRDIIDMLRQGGEEGRIEFTGSAKYHSFLPMLDDGDDSVLFEHRFALPVDARFRALDVSLCDDLLDRQIEFLCKLEVAFVVGGDCHHGAGAVGGEDVISNVDRDLFFGRGVHCGDAFELHPRLLLIFAPLPFRLLRRRAYICLDPFFI